MSPLHETNRQIHDQIRSQRLRRAERARRVRPIQVIDALIADLEELHLAGRKRVPDGYDARLQALRTSCPEAEGRELRSRITIVHLMDQLYEIQELLLEVKSGAPRDAPEPDGHSGLREAS